MSYDQQIVEVEHYVLEVIEKISLLDLTLKVAGVRQYYGRKAIDVIDVILVLLLLNLRDVYLCHGKIED